MNKWKWKDVLETERLLILKSKNSRDLNTLKKHLKEDGDFSIFTGLSDEEQNISLFDLEESDVDYYSLYLKNTSIMIGYVGFSKVDEQTIEIEFYIFRDERKKGFCKESCIKLIEYIFNEGQSNAITATVTHDNNAALCFLKSVGFTMVPIIGWQLLSIDGTEYDKAIEVKVMRIERGEYRRRWKDVYITE